MLNKSIRNKIRAVLCAAMAIVMLAVSAPFTAFASDGGFRVSEAVIVISPDAPATDGYAAKRLKFYLDKITGKDIPIQTEPHDGYVIRIGKTEDSSPDGSYSIVSDSVSIVIGGTGNKGTINGVYAFLEKYCGCHWYETNVTVIPENPNLEIASGINDTYTQFFEYTETDTNSSRDVEFSLANGLVGAVYRSFTDEQGGGVGYIGRFAHTLTTEFCSSETYFDGHPEYFALRNGKRTPNQLCLTNPDVIDVVTAEVLARLETEHKPEADMQIISLTQHDNFDYCQCDNCKALDDANGSQSGTMITFVNEVARRVKAGGSYDNVVFDTFAYQYTRKPPSQVRPREDVIVRLCSIECCFGHTLDDADCELNADFMSDLKEWGKICNRIYIWDYVNNYAQTACIFPNFGVLQRNVQVFCENNVKGIYEEGNYYIADCDAEFAEMRTYLLSKLMQNPYLDYSAEMNGYLNAVYGEGGVYIREFIDIMTAHAVTENGHLSIYQASDKTLYGMTNEDIARCDELWEKAKEAAKTDEELSQLLRSELCWRYWKCANKKGEFSRLQFPYVYMNAAEKLHGDLKEMGVRVFSEGGHQLSDCELLYLYRDINKWTQLYEEWFWDILNPAAVALYKAFGAIYNLFN